MNRTIKFRAWHKERKSMYSCYDWHYDDEYQDISFSLNFNNDDFCFALETKDLVLMQYTGLKDKNGKEIYEGDILDSGTKVITFWVVAWRNNSGRYLLEGMKIPEMKFIMSSLQGSSKLQIIGNIYENPELIK